MLESELDLVSLAVATAPRPLAHLLVAEHAVASQVAVLAASAAPASSLLPTLRLTGPVLIKSADHVGLGARLPKPTTSLPHSRHSIPVLVIQWNRLAGATIVALCVILDDHSLRLSHDGAVVLA